MALYLVARLKNEQDSKNIQTVIEYDPEPPFGASTTITLAANSVYGGPE
jgi:hypothetical protein